jgi:hypothetical protein
MSIELIQDLGGFWSRPFVTTGDPYKVDAAIVGLNPATPISTEMPRDELYRLMKDRPNFERWYKEHRFKIGKKTKRSRTRIRLGLFVKNLSTFNFTETNVNAFPTKDGDELKNSAYLEEGAGIANSYLTKIQPRLVIIHHADALCALRDSDYLALGNRSQQIHPFAKYHVDALWSNKPTHVFSLTGLAARSRGWGKDAILEIVAKIKEIERGKSIDEIDKISETLDRVAEIVEIAPKPRKMKMVGFKEPFHAVDWKDHQVEGIKNVDNPFKQNSKRWKRHELLLSYRKSLLINEYSRLCKADKLPPVSKKYFRKAIGHECINILDEFGQTLTKEGLSEFLKKIR